MENYSKYIDHTLLKPDASPSEIIKLCQEARKFNFKSVCINPDFITLAKQQLNGSDVLVCTVIGFPLGSMTTNAKVCETKDAIALGADEIDMVLNISQLKNHDFVNVINEIKEVKKACQDKILKVIIETCLLSYEDKVNACKVVSDAKADFIKTSTGFSTAGATIEDVKLLKSKISSSIKVKAAGGVKNQHDLIEMIKAGADRIGTSRGVQLIENLNVVKPSTY